MNKNNEKILHEWVRSSVKNDRIAQKKLYEYLYGKMMAVCYRYAKNREEAKDVLHEGFVKVFQSLHKYNFKGSLEGWVRRIMVNTAIDAFRKKKLTYSLDDEDGYYDHVIGEHENILSTLNVQEIMEAVQALSPAYRTIFNLYAIEGFSHKEIAEQLGISIGTSKSNYARAKGKLKTMLLKNEKISLHG